MMIHLTAVSRYEDEKIIAPISLSAARIVAVTDVTPASHDARGFTYGAEIAVDGISGVFCVTEDYSAVLRLLNDEDNDE